MVLNQLGKITNWNDELGEFSKFQFQHMKRELVKELMIELIKNDVNLSDLETTFSNLAKFLSNADSEKLSHEDKLNLQKVEQIMAVA
jgi:hypothetical protein